MSASAVLRRRLAEQLRALREQADLSQQHVADTLNVTIRTITRAENAETTPGARDLARFLDLYGVDREHREELLDLGTQARKRGGWWSAYKDLLPGPYMQLEAEARELRNYEPAFVPGLLQTEDYARQTLARTRDVERHVAARMQRQQRVTSGELSLRVLIDEAVLHRLCPQVAQGQLEHLLKLAELPTVSLRVVPFSVGTYPAMGQEFVVLSFRAATDPDVAMAEMIGGERYFDDAEEVTRMNAIFDEIDTLAEPEDNTKLELQKQLKVLAP